MLADFYVTTIQRIKSLLGSKSRQDLNLTTIYEIEKKKYNDILEKFNVLSRPRQVAGGYTT